MTPPGSPLEGHIYLNDPTGETITYYKKTKTAYSAKPGGETQQFINPEALLTYLTTLPSTQKSANSLSQTEMDIITDVAHSYGLKPTIDYIGPKATGTPFMVILDKSGQRRFNIRKLANKFFFNKFVYTPNVVKGEAETILHGKEWNTLVKEMHTQFATLAQPTMTVPSKEKNTLSQTEMMAISKLAKSYMLGTTQPLVGPEQSPSIIIQGNMGSNIWLVRKFEAMYEILNIISDKNWEKLEIEPTFAEMLIKLKKLFETYIAPSQTPTSGTHNGITPEEAEQIKMEVEQYGPLFWTEYVKGSQGQNAYVEVFYKAEGNAPAYIVFSVGALGNYYQINDAQNKAKENSTTFEGIVARIHDRLAELSGQKSEPHQVSVPHKLLEEEQQAIAQIIGKYAPSLTYQLTPGDAIVIWVGAHITSYKVSKENDVYRVYTDKDGEWVIQNQFSTINELLPYLDDLLKHIAKALANTKLDQPPGNSAPSLNPDKLSASEVDELKKLIKKFKLPIQTSYTKKLMEAQAFPQEAYSMTISDSDHKVWVKIYKEKGLYVFSKGLSDAYFPLKKFALFVDLMNYTDYFFNSYIKEEAPGVEKITDEEVKMLKDLVQKYKVNGKVRRKYMTAKGEGKVPYVFIELDDVGFKDYAISKTEKGVYKLFQVDTLFEDWKNLAITDTWEGIYDIIGKVLNDEPIPDEKEKYNPSVLNDDQFEWLETFMKTHKPGVFVKKWGNGVIGGYDPSVKINGESNPLFVIRFAHDNPQNARILQVQTKDGGMDSDEYPFNTFEALAHFIVTNIEVVTQLLKGETAPESKLAELMEKGGFKFSHQKMNVNIDGVNKDGNVYENDDHDRIYLFSDGGSRVWYVDHTAGEAVSKDFKTMPELVSWMEGQYGGKESGEPTTIAGIQEMQEYLTYLGFYKDTDKSDKWETRWTKQVGPDHQKSWDIVSLESDATAKVKPSPLIGDPQHGSVFYFNTLAALKQYLTEKYSKGKNWHDKYLEKVFVEGKFQKIEDQNVEMGFKWVTNKMIVVPFPVGGIMETPEGVDPHVRFTFENTYDLARRLELYVAGDIDYQDPGWATGYEELDELIDKAGFIYQGHEETQEGEKLVFLDAGGIKLVYYTGDETASLMFPPSASGQQGLNFPSVEDLIEHLKEYVKHPESPDAQNTFATNAGYAGLVKTLEETEFKDTKTVPAPDEQPYKVFKRPDGAGVTIWDNGVCAYKAPSDKAEWEYSKGFAALDDKLKKLYGAKTSTSETSTSHYPSILKYDPETQDLITKDLANINSATGGAIDSIHFQYNNSANGQGEIRALGGNVLKFAIGKKIVGNNVLWYVRQKVSDSPNGLYRVYTFVEHHKDAMVKWITDHIQNLITHKSVKDVDGSNLGTAEGPTVGVVPKASELPEPKYVPGKMYYPDIKVVNLLKSKGFEPEMLVNGTSWVHPSKFHFELYEGAIMWHAEKFSKEFGLPMSEHFEFLKKALEKAQIDMDDDQLDQLFSAASVSRQEKLLEKAIDIAAGLEGDKMPGSEIDKALQNKGFEWYDEERCWVNDELFQVVIVNPKESAQSQFRFWWVEGKDINNGMALNETDLLQWVGPNGKITQSQKWKANEQTGGKYDPSGETYEAHSNEANADMIWLDYHDQELLNLMGFIPAPQENHFYKHSNGNIAKFFDTGKAEYIDFFGQPDKPENGEVIEFDNIPHALKFIVAKHASAPFSQHNYKSDDGTNVAEIPLNQHDHDILASLGFEWNEKGQHYIKILGPNDTPTIHAQFKTKPGDDAGHIEEAWSKKKKKKDEPGQPELPFGGPLHPDKPEPESDGNDQHEVFTAYDTGKAIWQRKLEVGLEDKELELYEGLITNVLYFIWQRWKHQLQTGLTGKIVAKGLPPTTLPPDTIALLNIEGVEAPPNIHEKFLQRGFIYETSLKGYYKKYEVDPKLMWTLVKWDGTTYYVSRPYKGPTGKIEHKEFANQDPYLVLNTILKIENADFMDLVQSEEDALKKKDAKYFNAPNGWTPYNPYSPKKNPGNIKPVDWIDKELGGYGFEWKPDGAMYYLVDTEGKIGTQWQAVRFDKNGTIVYFYHDKKGEPRYFCSKDFAEVQHKMEVNHPSAELFTGGGTSVGTVPPKQYPLNAKDYPTAPDWDKNFSQTGNAITLKPADHKAVLEVGFKFSVADGTYSNPKTKDQFKIFSNGFAWYKMTGIGEGMDNNLEHFFDMLKSKYGQLEWGFHPLTGHEVVQIKDKFDKMGFNAVEHPEAADDLYFEKHSPDGKLKEVVVVFPNHSMNFYLYDATSKDKLLGVSEFESLTYGIHTLEDFHVDAIKLHLAHDLEPELASQGFTYVPEKQRYEHALGNGGLKISITFFGDGQADANLWEPDSSTSDGFEEVKEKTFISFYDAILWSAHKNFEIQPQPAVPVNTKEVKKVMKNLGFKDNGFTLDGSLTFSTSMGKSIFVNPKDGKVKYRFQYVANDKTGELLWGTTVFYNWATFEDFLKGTTQVKPTSGKLPFTPHPATKEIPKIPPPGQGPPIKGKIQGKIPEPAMPFSGYDYEGWAKGTTHNPNSTIKLVNNDDLLMHQLGFFSKKDENDAYYYHNNKGDFVYFFVDGHAKIIPKDQAPITLPKVKMAIGMLWAQHYEDKTAGLPPTPDVPNVPENKFDVTKELSDLGFNAILSSGSPESPSIMFEKKDDKVRHLVLWDKKKNTLDYQSKKIDDPSVVVASWEEDAAVGLAMLAHIFTPKLSEQEFVVKKMEELGFNPEGGKPPKGAQSNTITFHRLTKNFLYDVIYHVEQKMMEFIKSTAKLEHGHHNIVEQWTLNVSDALGKLEDLFAFGSMGAIPLPPKKKKKVLAGTEDMPWAEIDYTKYWKDKPDNHGMILGLVDEKTMAQMGWKRISYQHGGYAYQHGNELMIFYKLGHVGYMSDVNNGQITQSWSKPEDAVRWLWKNKGSVQKPTVTGEMPWSNMEYDHSKAAQQMGKDPVYTTITLYSIEEETMKKMGFHRLENGGVKWYEKSGTSQHVMFFADGHASITDKLTGTEMEYFKTVKECLQHLWNKYMPFIEESFFKDLVNVLMTRPDAAKLLS